MTHLEMMFSYRYSYNIHQPLGLRGAEYCNFYCSSKVWHNSKAFSFPAHNNFLCTCLCDVEKSCGCLGLKTRIVCSSKMSRMQGQWIKKMWIFIFLLLFIFTFIQIDTDVYEHQGLYKRVVWNKITLVWLRIFIVEMCRIFVWHVKWANICWWNRTVLW
jgi:hypothetical protein